MSATRIVLSICALMILGTAGQAAEPASAIQSYLDSLAADNRLSGAILVAKDGQPIASKAGGLANRETNTPNTLETKFNLASMNKMFTAVAIGQLAQSGKLKFDAPIANYLPEYPNKEVARKVTPHHLLTHTSGMASYWGEKYSAQRTQLTSVAAHLPLFVNEPLSFTPGERFQYSNSGFMLLGAIIEKLSGKTYYDYVRDHVFAPAGMTGTGFYDPKGDNPDVAIGYTKMDANGQRGEVERPHTDRREVRGGPAGGGYSTVGDLVKFSIALTKNKLLDVEHTKIITSGKVDGPGGMGKYGYGFGDNVVGGKHIIGHNGGFPGTAANLDIFPELGYSAAILMNVDGAMMPVLKKLRELIPGA